jgi:HSP20 family protein
VGSKPRKRIPEPVAPQRAYPCYAGDDVLAGEPWVPPVDIYETDEQYILNAELPGVAREDIHIEISGSELTIRGERREDLVCSEESFYRVEGMRGHFCRTFTLPKCLDSEAVRTSLRDGVLSLVIPKSSRKTPAQPPRSGR